MYKFFLAAITLSSLILSAGCSGNASGDGEQHQHKPSFVHADIHEETASLGELPSFLQSHPEEVKAVYAAAAQHEELLTHIPCYCGCGDSVGHKHSHHCFIKERKENGAVVWDDHGTKCKVCLDIAAASIIELKNGKTPLEIRKWIDENYQEGYANPTPSPMPSV
ncbi:hypothetical protein GJU40_01760 [Bacillus lacus]|uniref:Lipoprotein n=1 Tax=Metabacillus lacus TaxID=1983721 RepID=A0A7X2IW51_9BACI|nr:PCYCGC motif-containing (lipo)protein [Metabacillus lacus]MRX70893.1 hypothetical protein [Metabacillus lacus]